MVSDLKRAFGAFALVAGLSASTFAAPVLIDDFTLPVAGATVQTANATAKIGFQSHVGILGNSREYKVTRTVGTVKAGTLDKGNGNVFTVDNNANTGRGTGQLHYDGNANGVLANSGLNVDLTNNGTNDQFSFRAFSVTGSSAVTKAQTFYVTVYDTTGNNYTLVQDLFIQDGQYNIGFVNFTSQGVDMRHVASLDFLFDNRRPNTGALPRPTTLQGQAGSDVEFKFLIANASTPEPGTLVLALTGAAGLAFVVRRQRKS
ncbi:MAG: PEP-CTERM sorting domain-containing protein [Planctomycetota bacterium]|nr:PEP-CTERM sorting domain-containing protein [Planctomycetota bacterium]